MGGKYLKLVGRTHLWPTTAKKWTDHGPFDQYFLPSIRHRTRLRLFTLGLTWSCSKPVMSCAVQSYQ